MMMTFRIFSPLSSLSTGPGRAVHGLAGTPEDLTYLKQGLEHRSGDGEVLVHLARCNKGKTKDGVAEGGSRLADEVGGWVLPFPP